MAIPAYSPTGCKSPAEMASCRSANSGLTGKYVSLIEPGNMGTAAAIGAMFVGFKNTRTPKVSFSQS